MACYKPWRKPGENQVLPCGQCSGCRRAHAREWAMRCMHEASMHRENCFLTLTYDAEHLPKNGSLDRRAYPLFMKRLRKEVGKVRYFHVGEYGENTNRPHYHALLFGWSPGDKKMLSVRNGFPVFTSELLRKAWPFGLHEVGSVTPESAGYVSRYIRKRMTGSWAKAKYGDKEPEYGTMSRNPGIGAGWIDSFRCEVYPADSIVVRGSYQKPPRYYDNRVAAKDPAFFDGVKLCRFARRRRENETPERLRVSKLVADAGEAIHSHGGVL